MAVFSYQLRATDRGSGGFTFMDAYRPEEPLPAAETADGFAVTLPAIEPFGTVTVFC